jgi:hypothetical protein
MANADKCYFCDKWSEYTFSQKTPVCQKHWNMMWSVVVPNHIDASQILNFKRLTVRKQIWKV